MQPSPSSADAFHIWRYPLLTKRTATESAKEGGKPLRHHVGVTEMHWCDSSVLCAPRYYKISDLKDKGVSERTAWISNKNDKIVKSLSSLLCSSGLKLNKMSDDRDLNRYRPILYSQVSLKIHTHWLWTSNNYFICTVYVQDNCPFSSIQCLWLMFS